MRKILRPRPPHLLLAAIVIPTGCSPGTLDDATRGRVAALGDSAAMSLVRTLGARLNAHLASGAPGLAVEFCSAEALVLTDSVAASLGPGWELKRTTTRTRNPANEPDSLETEALRFFTERADSVEAEQPERLVQEVGDGAYRYYMPLRIGPMCLQCHGPRDALEPAVRRALDALYPEDRATGYAAGDLRGVVRVTVPRGAVR
jgi:hypothetical protein